MSETTYDLCDDDQVLALGRALVAFGFDENAEADWSDPASIRELLSDVDWYPDTWKPGSVDTRHHVGFHPVAGEDGRWPTFMWKQGNKVHLVVG